MEFSKLAGVFEKLEATSKRLELTDDLAELFKATPENEIKIVAYLCAGVLLPEHHGIDLGLGDKFAERAIALVSGKSVKEVETDYRKTGDLGDTAERFATGRKQTSLSRATELSVKKVYDNFYKIATLTGTGSQDLKIKLLAELLSASDGVQAKAIIRFVTGGLRLGIGEPTILDALSVARQGDKGLRPALERAFNMTSDIGLVAELFFSKGIAAIEKIEPQPFSPIRPALAERLDSAEAIVKKLGKCAVEQKYDGLRLQCHKAGNRVEIFSRRQEPMTHMFPDLIEKIRKTRCRNAIFEGEALAVDEAGNFLPFQQTIQRKRKHGIAEKGEDLPLVLVAFELLYLDGKDLTNEPFHKRRELLERIAAGSGVEVSRTLVTDKEIDVQKFFEESVTAGLEGIVAKDLNAPYTAGARKFAWIKYKRSYAGHLADSVDAVIVGYYIGKGKRTKFGLGGVLCAVFDESERRFKTIAKVGSGFDEKELASFFAVLEELKTKKKPDNVDSVLEPDFWVKPKVVITIVADEITRSPTHTAGATETRSGFALRFPRITVLREDKKPQDATTVKEIEDLFELQGK